MRMTREMAVRSVPLDRPSVHERVGTVVDAYLRAVDAEAPGLVEGLYLLGSVALGEFRPHTSDIDYLAVTAAPPDAAALAALARTHRRVRACHPRPFFDGRYVTWRDLSTDPRILSPGPSTYEGRFRADAAARFATEASTVRSETPG